MTVNNFGASYRIKTKSGVKTTSGPRINIFSRFRMTVRRKQRPFRFHKTGRGICINYRVFVVETNTHKRALTNRSTIYTTKNSNWPIFLPTQAPSSRIIILSLWFLNLTCFRDFFFYSTVKDKTLILIMDMHYFREKWIWIQQISFSNET